MTRNIFLIVAVAIVAAAMGAYAQSRTVRPEDRIPTADAEGRAPMGVMAGGGMMGAMTGGMAGTMMPADRAMMSRRERRAGALKADDAKLDRLLERMDRAQGPAKTDAMAAVISELVSEREEWGRREMAIEPEMMQHLVAHMQSGTMTGMLRSLRTCPLVQAGEATASAGAKHGPPRADGGR